MEIFLLVFILISCYICLSFLGSIPILSPKSSLAISEESIETNWKTTYVDCIQQLPKATDFSISAFDGITISGKYFKSKQPAKFLIIGLHGWNGTWIEMLKYLPTLEDYSFDLVLYDHRGHGASGKAHPTGGVNEAKDLLAVTEWVRKNTGFENKKIGWYGSSWGASTALIAGGTKIDIGFIIADAPFQNWYSAIFERAERDYGAFAKYISIGVMKMVDWRTGTNHLEASPILATKKIEAPILLIHSKTDLATDFQQSVNISKNLNAKSKFHLLDWGGEHTLDVVVNKDKFHAIVHDFLKKVDGDFFG